MTPESAYWFRAKSYGWGWGLPLTWQGWAVLVGYMLLLLGGSPLLLSSPDAPVFYLVYVALLSATLIGVCYAKGEPPKWRWGR